MMQWLKVRVEETCGMCGKRIYIQQPAQRITLPNVKRHRYRCVDCVGPAPPDLPDVIETTKPERVAFQPIARTAATFTRGKLSDTDWTARILGERDS